MNCWKNFRHMFWAAGTLAGLLFLGLGAFGGQFRVIFQKAAMICLECIGIG